MQLQEKKKSRRVAEEEVEGEKTFNDSAGLDQQSGIRSVMAFGSTERWGM